MKRKSSMWRRLLAGGLSAAMIVTGMQGLPGVAESADAAETSAETSAETGTETSPETLAETLAETQTLAETGEEATGTTEDSDTTLVYFVDCGDYVVDTVCSGDAFGTHNSVTDQVYGADAKTGYNWGIVDTVSSPLANGSSSTGGAFSDHTWPYEFNTAGKDATTKTDSNRYTKNQYENGVAVRYLDYEFQLEAGNYRIDTYTKDPWGCSKSPTWIVDTTGETSAEITTDFLAGEGTVLTPDTNSSQKVQLTEESNVMVSYRANSSTNLAINVCYIMITDISNEDTSKYVDADLEALSFANTTLTGNVTLPTTGENGSTITWQSSNPDILGADGTVYRPEAGSEDVTVMLTATVTYGENSATKNFYFTVQAMSDWTAIQQFELNDVTVTDSYYASAEEEDVEFLKEFDADRLLSRFRETAGLDTGGKEPYNGWEDSYIGGHTMGHYLSACAQEVKATGDAELSAQLTYIVSELKKCQDALGTGFIFGAQIQDSTDVEKQFDIIEGKDSGSTWVPWYTMHKILAGLIDVYKYTGNQEALDVASALGDWVYNRVSTWDSAVQARVLAVEYGGMNDCLYELYKITGKEEHKTAAHMFDETSLFEAVLAGGTNVLNGKHANTTIPKFLGALNRYSALKAQGETLSSEDELYLSYAEAFWTMVVENHVFVTGGTSDMEHFKADNSLDATRTQCNCESCCAYNMLKLSRELYKITGSKKYMDYYETTLRNAIMGAINTENGTTTYFTPMATGYYKYYSDEDPDENQFWCCTGSGMEDFTKLGDSIYFTNGTSLIVNQYVASNVNWTDGNVAVTQVSDVTSSTQASFTLTAIDASAAIAMTDVYLRVPDWISDSVTVEVNGVSQSAKVSNGYVHLSAAWQSGDVITFHYPMEVTATGLSDNSTVYAFKYGPTVLAATLGTEKYGETVGAGVDLQAPAYKVVGSESAYLKVTYGATVRQILGTETLSISNTSVSDFMENINDYLVRDAASSTLSFKLTGTDADDNFTNGLTFVPFNTITDQRYGIYWYFTGNDSTSAEDTILSDKEEGRFAASILDSIQPGYSQYETDEIHQMAESNTVSGNLSGVGSTRYASAGGSFSYQMIVNQEKTNNLVCQYVKADNGKTMKITVGSTVLAQETLNYEGDDSSYTKTYEIPAEEVAKASTITVDGTDYTVVKVTFESNESNDSARLAGGLYMTRAYEKNAEITAVALDSGTASVEGTEITAVVPVNTETVKATFTIADKQGLLYMGGNLVNDTKAQTITLSSEKTVVSLKVYGEDHTTAQDYTMTVYYEGSQPSSTDKDDENTDDNDNDDKGDSDTSDDQDDQDNQDEEDDEEEEPVIEYVTLKYVASTGGTISGSTTQKIVKGKNATKVTAKAKSGYQFVKWSDGVTTASRTDKSVKVSKTLKATFVKVVTKVTLNSKKLTLGVKETYTLKATATPSSASKASKKIKWKSSNSKVVTVSSSGKLTAKKTGTVKITATSGNGKKATCTVTVKKSPTSIKLNVKSKTLKKNKTLQLKVTLSKNSASNKLTFTSSKKSVATVSSKGKVTAKKKGTAVITVKSYNGKKAKVKITVK